MKARCLGTARHCARAVLRALRFICEADNARYYTGNGFADTYDDTTTERRGQ